METPTIVYDLDTSGGLMEVRPGCSQASAWGILFCILASVCALCYAFWFIGHFSANGVIMEAAAGARLECCSGANLQIPHVSAVMALQQT